VQFLLTVALSLLAAPYGLIAVAVAYVFRAYVTMIYQIDMLRKRADIDPFDTFRSVAPTFLCAVAMAILVFLASRQIGPILGDGWLSVLALSALGTGLYALFVVLFARNALSDALEATGASNRAYFSHFNAWLRR
jgi:hypothetical protein